MKIQSSARIIALCGPEGVGKTYLTSQSSRRRVSFADPLREIVAAMTGIPANDLRNQEVKKMPLSDLSSFDPDDKRTVRDLLIETGDFMRRINETYFAEKAVEVLSEDGEFIIDDLRFDNELKFIKDEFGDDVEVILVVDDHTLKNIDNDQLSIVYRDRYTENGIVPDSVYFNSR